MFIPAQTIITQVALFCICMCVRIWNELDRITRSILMDSTSGALLVWSVALELSGRLELGSRRLLRSWKNWNWSVADKKLLSKFRKSCRPICMRAGSYHVIQRTSVLKFLRGIVRGTFRALLTINGR